MMISNYISRFSLTLLVAFMIVTILNAQQSGLTSINAPDRIMLTIPGDPATTAAVSWRTDFNDTISIGQIATFSSSSAIEAAAVTVKGSHSPWEAGSKDAMGHKVIFENLLPETSYVYRVGNNSQWSEWFQFKTASKVTKPFTFIYLGDIQNDIKSHGSRLVRQAYSHFSDANFILYAGDLVSRNTESYWSEFFYAGGWIYGTIPSLPTPGNHEYYTSGEGKARLFSDHWKQIFTMPDNSPSPEFDARTYYMDYQGVRFVSIDSPGMTFNEENGKLSLQWLEKTLASNPHRWTVVFTHFPVYSCSEGRDNKKYRDMVKPVLEKYGVDLVLQGHDHTYCRGQNLANAGEKVLNPPMYVVSVAGPKMYKLPEESWADKMTADTQLYQHIKISGDTVVYNSYTLAGELHDSFSLVKDKSGVNQVVVFP